MDYCILAPVYIDKNLKNTLVCGLWSSTSRGVFVCFCLRASSCNTFKHITFRSEIRPQPSAKTTHFVLKNIVHRLCLIISLGRSGGKEFFQRSGVLQTRVLVWETLEEANKFERLPSAWATGGCGVKRILSGRACSYKEKRLTTLDS
jgi:hypothetical protein